MLNIDGDETGVPLWVGRDPSYTVYDHTYGSGGYVVEFGAWVWVSWRFREDTARDAHDLGRALVGDHPEYQRTHSEYE